ncbi:MAG TPA: alkene reductase [Acidimicrobiaceae bacterium]|nr:alkene reductase [Acidimicrobiaceae bacterium]
MTSTDGDARFVNLMTPARFGRIHLRNRVVMAPMTRARATPDGAVTDIMVEYYRQRAGAGMIITEGVYPSEDGKGYCRTPGLVSSDHAAGWRRVTEAVHAEGGTIVMQMMHVGRVAVAANKAAGAETIAPSAVAARLRMYTDVDGGTMQPCDPPRALDGDEIPAVIADYVRSTELAFEAGFDGVELHGTSGYLPAQFLSTGTNHRDDDWGGSVAGRIRFFVEVASAMADVDGADRIGFRVCPGNPYNDLHDDDPEETFRALLAGLDPLGLAYCHTLRLPTGPVDNEALCRQGFSGPLIINDSYEPAEANQALAEGRGDAVAFGRRFITNPDLVDRIAGGHELASTRVDHIYDPGPQGYIDFPTRSD